MLTSQMKDTIDKLVYEEMQTNSNYETIMEIGKYVNKNNRIYDNWIWNEWEKETFYISEDPDDYIIDTRQLSKKHLFDFEIKYRPIFVQHPTSNIDQNTKLTLKLLDTLIDSGNLYGYFSQNVNDFFDFLDSYKDIISWHSFLKNNEKTVRKEIYKITDKYKEFFNNECWTCLTHYCYDYREGKIYRKNYIRTYRDKLDWNYLSGSDIDFDPYFIVEMKNYIDFDLYFRNLQKHSQIKNQIKMYTLNNLEEVLTYKKQE